MYSLGEGDQHRHGQGPGARTHQVAENVAVLEDLFQSVVFL